MVAFDLIYLDGYDLRKLTLLERKALLKKLIAKTAIQFSESFEVDGREIPPRSTADPSKTKGETMPILLWLVGIPIPPIILIMLLHH